MAVSSPLSVKVTPGTSSLPLATGPEVPLSEKAMSELEVLPSVAVMVKVPAVPTVKVAAAAEVIVGGSLMFKVKLWVASGWVPLLAVMVMG